MTARVLVVRPGLQTTVQDLGRWGWQARGVPVAGPMDPFSHRHANAMVRNSPDAATLEVTLLGPELEFEDERLVSVAGAVFELEVDGRPVGPDDMPVRVHAGARLRFGNRRFGGRAYLAVEGGIATPGVFGSRATDLTTGMGGLEGRSLDGGDTLPLGDRRVVDGQAVHPRALADRSNTASTLARADGRLTADRDGSHRLMARVRVVGGRHGDRFAGDAMAQLQSAAYIVGNASNRMGCRLEGPPLPLKSRRELLSEATPAGSLQVPPSEQPILLLADRQTTGGYAKIASVIAADMGIAGQLSPGDSVTFELVSIAEAVDALRSVERELRALEIQP